MVASVDGIKVELLAVVYEQGPCLQPRILLLKKNT